MSLLPQGRPRLDLDWTQSERILAGFSLLGLGLVVAVGVAAFFTLPDQVPVHFDLRGEPDRWAGPGGMLILPVIAILTWLPMHWLVGRPHLYNYPAEITAENAESQYRFGRLFLLAINLATMLLFLGIVVAQWLASLQHELALGSLLGLVGLYTVGVLGGAVYWLVRSRRAS